MDWRRELMGGLSSGIDINNYLTIEALEDGLTASLSVNTCEYCVDGNGNWKSLAAGTVTESINSGQTLSFRGNLTPTTNTGIGTFTVNKNFNLKGNCMSMLFGNAGKNNYSLSGKNYAFKNLFRKCTTLKSVVNSFLPATTLANYCYYSIFDGCTNLTTAPELPATTLTDSCYYYMFYECTNLTTAPALPATTLAKSCYNAMFRSTGLVTAPELPATTLASYCYNMMFYNCWKLTNAPTLPATVLANSCYCYMFYNCTKLNYIKMLATDISASSCLSNWVNGVASTGTFVKNPAMTSLTTGQSGIPSGWTVINDGEESGGG